jgi:Secretion system C-terminal sorting domain
MNTPSGSRVLARVAILLVLFAAVTARAQWRQYGLPLGGIEATGPRLAPDGSGGAIFLWNDAGFEGVYGEVYIQRVTADGVKQWTCCGKPILSNPVYTATHQMDAAVVADGAGGAIVVWLDSRNEGVYLDIYAQRFDGSGTAMWSDGGVPVCMAPHFQWNMVAIPDGYGGAIIAWSDFRNLNDSDLYAQRIDAAGAPQWNVNGVAVCTAGNQQEFPVALADGLGGAWISWRDARNGYPDIFARRVDAAGVPQGVADGIAICADAGFQYSQAITSDGSGGAIVAWIDDRNGGFNNGDVYAQSVDADGTLQWTTDGVGVCNADGMQEVPAIADDGSGGAFVVWRDSRVFGPSLFGQRIDAAGVGQWTADGDSLAAIHPYDSEPSIMSDGSAGAIVTWIGPGNGANEFVRVQRLDANGEALWTPWGVPVGWDEAVRHPAIVSDGSGGAIVAWEDGPPQFNSVVMAGHVTAQGWPTDVGPTRVPSLIVADVYPNPFSGTASIAIEIAAPSTLQIDIFDVTGRKVRSIARSDAALSQVVELGDRDDAGRLLASGVYFCRVRAAGESVTRKMVIAR